MRRRSTFSIALLAALCFLIPAARAQEAPKLAFVNMQAALENSTAGQQATRLLSDMWEKAKAEIQSSKEALEALKAEIDKQSMLWNEQTRRDKEEELRRLERDYARLLKDTQDEIKAKESELSETISKEILKIVKEYGEQEGYSMIFEKKSSAILFALPATDLTDTIIKLYNSRKQ